MSDPSLRSVENALDRIRSVANSLGATAPWVAGMTTPARRGGYDGSQPQRGTHGDPTEKAAMHRKLAQAKAHRGNAHRSILKAAVHLENALGDFADACRLYDEACPSSEIGQDILARVATRAEVALAGAKQAYRDSQRPKGTPHGEG